MSLGAGRDEAKVHRLMDQRVEHAVVVPVRLHVIVEVHGRRFPFAHLVTLGRQRLQRGPIQLLEPLRARAGTFAKWPLVRKRTANPGSGPREAPAGGGEDGDFGELPLAHPR